MRKLLKLLSSLFVIQQTAGLNKQLSDTDCGSILTPSPCEGFQLDYGSIRAETRLWLLEEYHFHQQSTLSCIEHLTKGIKKHTIYLEGAAAEEKVSCDEYPGLKNKPGRTCKGWDNLKAFEEMTSYFAGWDKINAQHKLKYVLMNLKETYESYQLEGINEVGFDRILKAMTDDLNKNKQKITGEYDLESLKAGEWLLGKRKKGKSYKNIFNNIDEIFAEDRLLVDVKLKDINKVQKLFDKRQESLLSTLQRHPIEQFGIFVAGANHLTDKVDSGLKLSTESIKAIKNHLEELADENNPFAVLASNDVMLASKNGK